MLDGRVQTLLEEITNTSTKLAVMLLFSEQPNLIATPSQLQQRVCRDIWSVRQALDELVKVGALREQNGCYGIVPGMHRELAVLQRAYNEPLYRQEIMQTVMDLESYAPYRSMLSTYPRSVKMN